MNKPTKIVPLDADESQPLEKVAQPAKPAKQERGSLLERASGAFGLDRLMPARVPAKLPEGKSRCGSVRAHSGKTDRRRCACRTAAARSQADRPKKPA